ncbi:MAG: two-component sensor histidine kinase [Rhodoferax sp.]|nr:two-component sensor histidine kinase [Rhodoferax sp.]
MSGSDGRPVDLRQRVDQLERELAQVQLALEDFTYSVSHDLRASLRHVTAYLRIAREDLGDALDPAIADHLDTAAGAATRMGRLMDGLMELSRVGRAVLQPAVVDLGALLDDVRHHLEPACEGRALRWHVAPDLPRVHGDLALLNQLLTCLVDNAIKFSRDRDLAEITIGWTPLEAPGMCEIHVQDNGVGFDPRMQDRLFRVFQSLHSAREFDGIGVGLALARRVVERHGGQIRAQGEPGQGCRISLSLPLAA